MPPSQERLTAAAARLAHRGPDDTGRIVDRHVALVHTRLSIIDLAGGHQPLTADDGRLALIANGEIYNYVELRAELESAGYRFATDSDSEVVLHGYRAWGRGVLPRLHGMFAIALYDRVRGELLLARDRLGIKPLFLRQLGDGIAFGSELKALTALGERPAMDLRSLAEFFAHQFVGGRRTIFEDSEKLLPGEAVLVAAGRIRERWRYWDVREVETREQSFETAAEGFDELFETVCREHLRADVPLGLFLSGGVDSGILAAQMRRLYDGPLAAYSVGFSGAGFVDELPLAEAQASQLGLPLTAVRPSAEDLINALPQSIWAADDLMRDFANLPTLLLARTAGRQHKVVFSGEGGDEVFGGYRRYRRRPEDRLKAWLRPGSGGFRTGSDVPTGLQRRLYGPALRAAAHEHRSPFIEAWQATPDHWSDLQRRQYVDLVTALPDNLLVKADRMLMRYGIEGRVPFLDHRVVEFGLGLPDQLKLRDGHGKWFLKRWASRFLDEESLFAPKRGFYVPFRQRLGKPRLQRLRHSLPRHEGIRELFRPKAVADLLERDVRRGKLSTTGFSLFQFALWYQLIYRGDGPPPQEGEDPLALLEKEPA